MEPNPKRRLPRNVRRTIEAALRAADITTSGVSPEVQEAVKLYLDTWVVGPLRNVVKWDNRDQTAYLDWKP